MSFSCAFIKRTQESLEFLKYSEDVKNLLALVLPIFYDTITRKKFYALILAIKDILVFLIFYGIIIASFSTIAIQFIELP
jgi:hypothetical protein